MRFVTVRELRLNPAAVWRKLSEGSDVVVTSNGKPVALMTGVAEESLEEELLAIRRARAQMATARLQKVAEGRSLRTLSQRRIDEIIAKTRTGRKP